MEIEFTGSHYNLASDNSFTDCHRRINSTRFFVDMREHLAATTKHLLLLTINRVAVT